MFPGSTWLRQAGTTGGCMTAVHNAANEEAAEAFLQGRISFPAIVRNRRRGVARCGPVGRATGYRGDDDAQVGPASGLPGGFHGEAVPALMMFALGIALFALCILISRRAARMRPLCGWRAPPGMKVRR